MTPFTLTTGQQLRWHGPADRYHKNVAAIRLLRTLQAGGRSPETLTTDEQLALAHYSAFGESALLTRAVEGTDLTGLLAEPETATLRRTALTAFYTSTPVLMALWAALAPTLRHHASPLQVLEPAFGVGMVVATMPLDLRERAEITAVELDHVSSQIAAYLHPDVQLHGGQPFEATTLPADTYDLVISNVPFGELRVFDPQLREDYLRRTLHDYFIVRALNLVRPGGIVAVLTSYGTLDKRDARVRTWLAQRAELLTAVRLPQGVFHENAGTACGADILILRRHAAPTSAPTVPDWTGTGFLPATLADDAIGHFTTASRFGPSDYVETTDAAQLRVGQWFADHPAQVLGDLHLVRNGALRFSFVAPRPQPSLAEQLQQALAPLPKDLLQPRPAVSSATPSNSASTNTVRQTGLLQIYAAAKAVLQHDVAQQDAATARQALNAVYDAFVAAHGPIHARANQLALKGTPELLFLNALETDGQPAGDSLHAAKAPIFFQPTIRPQAQTVTGTLAPDAALVWCLDERGRVDLDRIAALCGQDIAATALALRGRIYQLPGTPTFVTADEYLAGNIREKLDAAQRAAATDPAFEGHVAALQAVMPAPLTPGQIKAKLGAAWVPVAVVHEFICTLIPRFRGSGYATGRVSYHRPLAKWVVADDAYSRHGHDATTTWGTGRMHALELIEKALNGQLPVIYDEVDGTRIPNQKETLLAREKLERIKETWASWVWSDPDRADDLCARYNALFNASRRRDFDGSHLTLPGINTTILRDGDLAPHQKDAVWMILQRPTVLLDLCVGAGKTFICLAAAHELRRLQLAQKILITVPNHLVEQWGREANRLYPDLRVRVMTPDDLAKARRGTFLSRIATEAWDVVICAHTSFGTLEPGPCAQEFIQREVLSLKAYLTELRSTPATSRSERRSIKEIERKVAALETKLKEREHALQHDDARIISWEELGIDCLIVDEAHEFKNLGVTTMMGNIPGIPKGDSKRAFDMRLKTWDLIRRGGRVVFATGTPVLNTLGEVFVMQTYLQEEVLAAHGIEHFDAWARTFAEVQTVFEMTPDGGGFRMNTRLCKFVNLPELFQLWFQFTFSRSREQLGLPAPAMVTGKPIPVAVPGSPTLKRLVQSFVARVEAIKRGAVEPTVDNMLKVTADGRKAALDVRLVGGAEEPVNKINVLVAHVAEIYHRYAAAKATQIVYCELATPKAHRPSDEPPATP